MKLFRRGSSAAMRSMHACVSSTGDTLRWWTRSAASVRVRAVSCTAGTLSVSEAMARIIAVFGDGRFPFVAKRSLDAQHLAHHLVNLCQIVIFEVPYY